jgi:hypothetical protein
MKEQYRLVNVAIVLAALIAVAAVLYKDHDSLPANLRNQFGCDRLTKEARATDIYCDDYRRYRLDHAAGKI